MPTRQRIADAGGRRFIATMVSGAGTWLLCALGIIGETAYVTATLGIVGAFVGTNTWQKVSQPQQPAPPQSGEQ